MDSIHPKLSLVAGALFEKLKAPVGFAGEDRTELLTGERMPRMFAASGVHAGRRPTAEIGDTRDARHPVG
jgi:hypothetical protein